MSLQGDACADLGARVSDLQLHRQMTLFSPESLTRRLLDSVPAVLAVLNRHRQIVYANEALYAMVGNDRKPLESGARPGEALGCLHASQGPAGCGTAEACQNCGAVQAIFAGLSGRSETREYSLSRQVEGRVEAVDLRVQTSPLDYQGERFTIFSVADVSHEKRRRVLEQIFFHDVLNVAGSAKGFAELLRDYDLEDRREVASLLHAAMQQMIDEIEAQRLLMSAESGELQVNWAPQNSRMLLERALQSGRGYQADGGSLCLDADVEEVNFVSDSVLLARILVNMVKNALEASRPGERVTLGCRRRLESVEFWVHNAAYIPRKEQLQIFQRSFSTKGRDRGLGTYSIRLLSEYLRGEVGFNSCEAAGTTFWVRYPADMGG